jgi:hypothetical protein
MGYVKIAYFTCVLAFLAAPSVKALTVAYNSFGLGKTNCNCFSPEASGPDATESFLGKGADWLAASFKSKASGTLNSIFLAVGLGGGYNGAVIVLTTDDGSGHPNVFSSGLETWVLTKVPAVPFGSSQMATRLLSKQLPSIQSGTTYWIILEPIGLDTDIVWWQSPKVMSSVIYSQTGGATWNGYTGSQTAFEVFTN